MDKSIGISRSYIHIWPLIGIFTVSNKILTSLNNENKKKYKYMHKIQLKLREGDGAAWMGSAIHSVHANTSNINRFSVFWVYALTDKFFDHLTVNLTKDTLLPVDYPHYTQGFEWISERSEMLHWMKQQNSKITLQNITDTVNVPKLIRFKC